MWFVLVYYNANVDVGITQDNYLPQRSKQLNWSLMEELKTVLTKSLVT